MFSKNSKKAEDFLHFLLHHDLHRDDEHGVLPFLHGRPRGLLQEEEESHGDGP